MKRTEIAEQIDNSIQGNGVHPGGFVVQQRFDYIAIFRCNQRFAHDFADRVPDRYSYSVKACAIGDDVDQYVVIERFVMNEDRIGDRNVVMNER